MAAMPADATADAPASDAACRDWNLTGFAGQVRVGTAFGDLPIEALRLRDEIRTSTGSIARVQWVDKVHLDADFVSRHASSQPILICANAFGPGRPMKDMVVSPRQELSRNAHVAANFREASTQCGVCRMKTEGLTYYRFHCGPLVAVRVEGVWARVAPPGQ